MTRFLVLLLVSGLPFLLLPAQASGGGGFLYPTAGYMFHLGGDAEDLEGAPSFGARLEYNFSRQDVFAFGLVYAFSRHDFKNMALPFHVEQHFCLVGYRFAKNQTWLNFGSHVGMGAVVKDFGGGYKEDSSVAYAMQIGLNMSFFPLPWLHVGPDASFMMTTDMDKWIFGGTSSYFAYLGGHVALNF